MARCNFFLETPRPLFVFGRSDAARGRTGSIGRATVLLESDTEERRDDASAGDERAPQRA